MNTQTYTLHSQESAAPVAMPTIARHKPLMRDGIWAVMGWKDLQNRSLEKEPNVLLWMAIAVMLSFILPVLAWSEGIQVASNDTLLPPPVLSAYTAEPVPTAKAATGTELPVLKYTMRQGERIDADDLGTRIVQGHFSNKVVLRADELIGKELFRNVRANAPIYESHVRFPPTVRKNGVVPILFVAAGIEIKGLGKALEDAAAGNTVRVMNEASGQTLAGIVMPNGTVEIR